MLQISQVCILSKLTLTVEKTLLLATEIKPSPLEAVYIFFDTASYDEIERDVKVIFRLSRCNMT